MKMNGMSRVLNVAGSTFMYMSARCTEKSILTATVILINAIKYLHVQKVLDISQSRSQGNGMFPV